MPCAATRAEYISVQDPGIDPFGGQVFTYSNWRVGEGEQVGYGVRVGYGVGYNAGPIAEDGATALTVHVFFWHNWRLFTDRYWSFCYWHVGLLI